MSDIHLSRPHRLDGPAREAALEALCEYLQSALSATVERREERLLFSGRGYSGKLSVGEAKVEGSVKLGMLVRPMKGAITREIECALDEYLQDS
ncbi:MAG: polyhydroxyalkanoic acid system family protein [Luminiphilus sp.]|mgnify:CR=1 FL=1|nr:polyhydroxyalkanoic acid system family protein [Luminiphilus sp.]